MDFYTVTTPASELPVTLAEAKAWCVIEHALDDTLIDALIKSATEIAEKFTNRVFVERTFKGQFAHLQCSKFEIGPFVEPRRASLKSITSVQILVDSVLEDVTDYKEKPESSFSRLIFTDSLPSGDDVPYPLEVVFVAGYGAASVVPEAIKTAIKELVCFMYTHKGDCDIKCDENNIPTGAKSILKKYRIINTY